MITALISEFMTLISGFDSTWIGLDEFLSVVSTFLGRFGFLGIRAI